MPPAWVQTTNPRRRQPASQEVAWDEPDPLFDAQFAAKVFKNFPIEDWCQSPVYKKLWQSALTKMVAWTGERLMPSWHDRTKRRHDRATRLIEWNNMLGDLLARSAPFFETSVVRQDFLAPFLADDDEPLTVLSEFAR